MIKKLHSLILAMIAAVLASPAASGQQARETRADVARAYQAFERAAMARMDDPEAWEFANHAIDACVESFFLGRFSQTIDSLDAATWQLNHGRSPTVDEEWLYSVHHRAEPTVLVADSAHTITLTLTADTPPDVMPDCRVRLRHADHPTPLECEIEWLSDGRGLSALCAFEVGRLKGNARMVIELVHSGGTRELATVPIVHTLPDDLRERLEQRLDAIEAPDDERLAEAMRSCRGRLTLLRDRPNPTRSASFLCDVIALADSLTHEVAALEQGKDPYADHKGSQWHIIERRGVELPFWLHVPERSASENIFEPMPIVLALHGAGGDESMFIHGYGDGLLTELADEHGFIVISPLVYSLAPFPKIADDLLAFAEARHRVDRQRVFIVGHSLGVMIMSRIVNAQPGRFAAASGIAGLVSYRRGIDVPPTFIFAGGLDRVIPSERVRKTVADLSDDSADISYELIDDAGHTLIVPQVLPNLIAWMLEQPDR